MQVTERRHYIGWPRRADLGKLLRLQFGDDLLAEVSRIVRDPLAQHGRIVLSLLRCARYIGSLDGGVVLALFAQVGRQDFHIPAAAGPDLDYGLIRPHSKESQRFERMAILVARRKFRSARGTGNRRG